MASHGIENLLLAIWLCDKRVDPGVQELLPVTKDTSLKVTVAKWLTPSGKSISEGGLTPDYEVKITADEAKAGTDTQMNKALELLAK